MPEFVLPEFTRSLRALALPTSTGPEDAGAFAPLLHARQLAHRAQSLEAQVAAFDAARLERSWRALLVTIAQTRHARSAPERRALEAELDHLAAPLWTALRALGAAGDRAKQSRSDARRSAWEEWVRGVHAVFRAADDWWFAARGQLARAEARAAEQVRRRPLWRRALGGAP
jgi:hypothetical protein